MTTMLTIVSKGLPDIGGKEIINPTNLPRIGDQIDMGYEPAPKVVNVLWQYPKINEDQIIKVTCVVE